ncbi:hypothetical protein UCRPC4_g00982 [Phaeomoniella chlamydospora]|uniref:Uncharacterized protein n=1 Tax=Phaeomoniella chlamydospora TaxID=158046 RepID=A0A0G2GX17_PHACM|nr:hypothetical protein UCRPC4_g00982 [Phaeomoniella chlamydospora]
MEGAPDDIDLYQILGISRDASKAEIKKAYHKAALAHHPDKVPDEDQREEAEAKFKSASQAYEILYDEEKRHLYDTHGMSAFTGGGAGGMGPDINDILSQMFGMGGGMDGFGGPGAGPRKPRKSPDEEQKYEVTLEDLYKGKTVRFTSTKQVICSVCSGSGGKPKAKAAQCSQCSGQGFTKVLRPVGPGLVTQQTISCPNCSGAGEVFNPKDKCKKCKGNRTTEEKKQLELYIPRGAKEGDVLRLEGEADQVPGQEPGDIVFHLAEVEHETFRRAGDDLTAEIDISLAEALGGFNRVVVKHLDGRGIQIQHPKFEGQIIRPHEVLKVPGEGMPQKRSDAKGDLFLIVNVEFPENGFFKDPQALAALQKLLPPPPPPIEADVVDEVDYDEDADLDEFGGADERGGSAWEDEDDGEHAQCAQQ